MTDHITQGSILAQREIATLLDQLDKSMTKISRMESIHARSRLVAARNLIGLYEHLKVERNKLHVMTRHATKEQLELTWPTLPQH